jgi:hypothetical protein
VRPDPEKTEIIPLKASTVLAPHRAVVVPWLRRHSWALTIGLAVVFLATANLWSPMTPRHYAELAGLYVVAFGGAYVGSRGRPGRHRS